MSVVIGVHGVAQQAKLARALEEEWEAALLHGVLGGVLDDGEIRCAFYGRLFRDEPLYQARDVTEEEAELLMLWWREAARAEPSRVTAPEALVPSSEPSVVQAAPRELARSTCFAGRSEAELISDLKQLLGYMRDATIQDAAQEAIDDVVDTETRVIVAHSLGSIVAYEALHRFGGTARWANVRALVTLGSPLGVPKLIFDRLRPAPEAGKGRWPAGIARWTNITDDADVLAMPHALRPLFGDDVYSIADVRVSRAATAHDGRSYLLARETGQAIAEALG